MTGFRVAGRWSPVGLIVVFAAVTSFCGCGLLGRGGRAPVVTESMMPGWYASNAAILTDYLDTLPSSQVGQPIDGILLSDGRHWLADTTYLGEPAGLPEGVNVRLLDDGATVFAYLWLDPGAEPFTLEPCVDGPQRGIRARRAGGGAYAWRSVRPEHGLVYTTCPPEPWLPPDRPSARPPEGG